jgi:hypothetical protein
VGGGRISVEQELVRRLKPTPDANRDFQFSHSFSTQLQHYQTATRIDDVYIIVSASASSIQ